MASKVQDYFGDVISVYTEKQGVDDGVLMSNLSLFFPECSLITTNLWDYIENKASKCDLTEPLDLLNIIMVKADDIYSKEKFTGDNDKDFFVLYGVGDFKTVWFARNGNDKLTAMLPEDY